HAARHDRTCIRPGQRLDRCWLSGVSEQLHGVALHGLGGPAMLPPCHPPDVPGVLDVLLAPDDTGGMAPSLAHYDSYTEARTHLKELLDAAERGRPVTVRWESARAAVVDAERLRHLLASASSLRAEVVPEAGGWSVFLSGTPIAADGATFDEAIDEMVD